MNDGSHVTFTQTNEDLNRNKEYHMHNVYYCIYVLSFYTNIGSRKSKIKSTHQGRGNSGGGREVQKLHSVSELNNH
jgi:hypothetical protein